MSTEVNVAKHVIHDKFESQLKTAEAMLDTLKARAETAKANAEIKAIAELAAKKLEIHHQLQEFKKSSGDHWEKAKADIENRIAEFEKAVHGIQTKIKPH